MNLNGIISVLVVFVLFVRVTLKNILLEFSIKLCVRFYQEHALYIQTVVRATAGLSYALLQ